MPDLVEQLGRYGAAVEDAALGRQRSRAPASDGGRSVRGRAARSTLVVAGTAFVVALMAFVLRLERPQDEASERVVISHGTSSEPRPTTWERMRDPFAGGFAEIVSAGGGQLVAIGRRPTAPCPSLPAGGFACPAAVVSWISDDDGRTWRVGGSLAPPSGTGSDGPSAWDIVWRDGRWYVIGWHERPAVWISSDGVHWTASPTSGGGDGLVHLAALAATPDGVLALGYAGPSWRDRLLSAWSIAPDGTLLRLPHVWMEADRELSRPIWTVNAMTTTAAGTVAVGQGASGGPYRWSFGDGGRTGAHGSMEPVAGWARDVAESGSGFVAVGVAILEGAVWTSEDGIRWDREVVEEPAGDGTEARTGLSDVVVGDSGAVALQEARRLVYARGADGRWRPVELPLEEADRPLAMAATGDAIVIVGYGAAWIWRA